MDKGLLNSLVFIDFRIAFDMIDINILIQKLEIYHCSPTLLSWFGSYLLGGNQCVHIKGCASFVKPVTHGVPQGSILGPLLFIIFVNDLPLYTDSNLDLYAGDSTLHAVAKTVGELNNQLTTEMSCIDTWCKHNNMVMNNQKTKSMIMTTHQKAAKLHTDEVSIHCNDCPLENVTHDSLLGVTIDKHLLWKTQVNKVAGNLIKGISLLRRIKVYLPTGVRLTFYKTFL